MDRVLITIGLLLFASYAVAYDVDDLLAVGSADDFALAVGEDGKAYATGDNHWGQLGNNGTVGVPVQVDKFQPVAIQGDPEITQVTIGRRSAAMAVTTSGEVWAWGRNEGNFGMPNSQLPCQQISGKGCFVTRPTKISFSHLGIDVRIKKVVVGNFTAYALNEDGRVLRWGVGVSERPEFTPYDSGFLDKIVDLDIEYNVVYALSSYGKVFVWAEYGLVKPIDGNGSSSAVPVRYLDNSSGTPVELSNVKAIRVKDDGLAYALLADGTIAGLAGEGIQHSLHFSEPTQRGQNYKDLAAGQDHFVALKADGTVWVYGQNAFGQFGNGQTGSYEDVSGHAQANLPQKILAVKAGRRSNFAIQASGYIYAWGSNRHGELGLPINTSVHYGDVLTPTVINGFRLRVPRPVSGDWQRSSFGRGSYVYSAGSSSYGGLSYPNVDLSVGGFESFPHIGSKADNSVITDVLIIANGQSSSHILRTDGTVLVWGLNDRGYHGSGDQTNRTQAVSVLIDDEGNSFADVIALSGSATHTLALKADGSVWAWGSNQYGQLGEGSVADHQVPFQVPGLNNIVAVAAGNRFSAVLRSDGTVFSWGQMDPRVAAPSGTEVKTPQRHSLLDVTRVVAGRNHLLMLTVTGRVFGMGSNVNKQLANLAVFNSNPGWITSLTKVSDISAGAYQSFAYLFENGKSVWKAWGSNTLGALGNGAGASPGSELATPVALFGSAEGIRYLHGGGAESHSTYYQLADALYASGRNDWGQLGRADRCRQGVEAACNQKGFQRVFNANLNYTDHQTVIGSCESCHDGQTSIGKNGILRKNFSHIASTQYCGNCHNSYSFSLVYSVDHNDVLGTCTDCHAPPTTHTAVGVTGSCFSCHSTTSWLSPYNSLPSAGAP